MLKKPVYNFDSNLTVTAKTEVLNMLEITLKYPHIYYPIAVILHIYGMELEQAFFESVGYDLKEKCRTSSSGG